MTIIVKSYFIIAEVRLSCVSVGNGKRKYPVTPPRRDSERKFYVSASPEGTRDSVAKMISYEHHEWYVSMKYISMKYTSMATWNLIPL